MAPESPWSSREDSEDVFRLLQEELAATDRDVLALALDLELRVEVRTAELREMQVEFQRTNSEMLRLTLSLEARTSEHTQEIQALREDLERQVQERTGQAMRAGRAKSLFLANMAHEIRTPLNAILGFSRLLLKDVNLPPRPLEFVQNIHHAGEHLLGTLNTVLELLKIEAGHVQLQKGPMDLRRLVRELELLFRAQAEAKGLAFRVEDQGAPERLLADEARLRQILVNLLANAVKFTDAGHLVLRFRGNGRLRMEVEDTGPGIPEEELERLFVPFEQGSLGAGKGGTGLGLAISRQFALLMGGDLSVEARPGGGSRFCLDLPLEELPVLPGSPEPSTGAAVADGADAAGDARAQMAALPDDLKDALRQALLVADYPAMLGIVQRIREGHPQAGICLQSLVQGFQYQAIQGLLGGAGP
jgi:signal transduction histidine kinase